MCSSDLVLLLGEFLDLLCIVFLARCIHLEESYNFRVDPVSIRGPETRFTSIEAKTAPFILNLYPKLVILETREIYTFWKLDISTIISSFFVEFIRGTERDDFSPFSFFSSGTQFIVNKGEAIVPFLPFSFFQHKRERT